MHSIANGNHNSHVSATVHTGYEIYTAHASSVLTEVPAATQIDVVDRDRVRTLTTHVIRLLLVDDHALVREGIRLLLELEQDMQVVGEVGNGLDVMKQVHLLQPDVILMDIHLPVVDGITLTQQITRTFPDTAVIMLTMQQQQQQVLQAMKYGARGYLLKSSTIREVAQAIRTVFAGGTFLMPALTDMLVHEYRRLAECTAEGTPQETLSEKECEIIRHVAAGMSNREIADHLAYSEKTVKNYLSIIFQKLHVRDRTQVAIFALRHGLLPDGYDTIADVQIGW